MSDEAKESSAESDFFKEMERFKIEPYPIYLIDASHPEISQKVIDYYLNINKPFGLEIGNGGLVANLENIDPSLPWISTEKDTDPLFSMDDNSLKFWGKDSDLDSTGPYFFLNAFASSEKMIEIASVLFYGNPDYRYFSDKFTPIPKKDKLRVGQRVVVLVNSHFRELDQYQEYLNICGYPPLEKGGQEFSKFNPWRFENGSWVMDYTKK